MYWEIDVKIRRLCDKRNVFGPLLVKLEGFYSLLLSSRLSVDHFVLTWFGWNLLCSFIVINYRTSLTVTLYLQIYLRNWFLYMSRIYNRVIATYTLNRLFQLNKVIKQRQKCIMQVQILLCNTLLSENNPMFISLNFDWTAI